MKKEIDYYKKYKKYKKLYLVEKNKNISYLVENFDWDKFNMKLNKNQKIELKKFFNVCKELDDSWYLGSRTSLQLNIEKYTYCNLFYTNKHFDNFDNIEKNEYYISKVIQNYLNLDDYTNIYYYKFPLSVDEIDAGALEYFFWFFFGKHKDGNYIMLILQSHGCGVYCSWCSNYYAFINNNPEVILSEIRVNLKKKKFQLERINLMTELIKNI